MADLLRRLIQQGDGRVAYLGQLLGALREEEGAVGQRVLEPSSVTPPALSLSDAGGLLTEREFEILVLLEQPLRNSEIADKLFVSRETVKTHLQNIYRKLNANGRLEAVSKARALGILSPL